MNYYALQKLLAHFRHYVPMTVKEGRIFYKFNDLVTKKILESSDKK